MRSLALMLLLSLVCLGSVGSAQDQAPDQNAQVTEVRHVERPAPDSLRRGVITAPGWAVYLGGGGVLLGAFGLLLRRMRGRTR